MEEEKEDWKESWIGWPSKDKSKSTPKQEVEGTTEKAQDYLKKLKPEEDNLGSRIYVNLAIFFGVTLVVFGFIVLFFAVDEYRAWGIVMIVSGFFTYVSLSWFGRVLKGLEQNNNYLKKILKERKI